ATTASSARLRPRGKALAKARACLAWVDAVAGQQPHRPLQPDSVLGLRFAAPRARPTTAPGPTYAPMLDRTVREPDPATALLAPQPSAHVASAAADAAANRQFPPTRRAPSTGSGPCAEQSSRPVHRGLAAPRSRPSRPLSTKVLWPSSTSRT